MPLHLTTPPPPIVPSSLTPSTSPPPPSKPPIIQVYTRRLTMAQPNPDSAIPDILVFEDSNNIDESHAISDELQTGPRYNLCDHVTIGPADKYGFSRVNAVVHEPSTYQEASGVLEWQLAMSEELAGTWDIVSLPSHAVPITCKWVFKN